MLDAKARARLNGLPKKKGHGKSPGRMPLLKQLEWIMKYLDAEPEDLPKGKHIVKGLVARLNYYRSSPACRHELFKMYTAELVKDEARIDKMNEARGPMRLGDEPAMRSIDDFFAKWDGFDPMELSGAPGGGAPDKVVG